MLMKLSNISFTFIVWHVWGRSKSWYILFLRFTVSLVLIWVHATLPYQQCFRNFVRYFSHHLSKRSIYNWQMVIISYRSQKFFISAGLCEQYTLLPTHVYCILILSAAPKFSCTQQKKSIHAKILVRLILFFPLITSRWIDIVMKTMHSWPVFCRICGLLFKLWMPSWGHNGLLNLLIR